jgi:hypothetical protein
MLNMHPDDAAELHGDGYSNEFQRSAAWSGICHRAKENPDDARISELLAKGFFVAVGYSPVYCRVTDAIIGESRRLIDYAQIRFHCECAVEAKYAHDLIDDETRVEILPRVECDTIPVRTISAVTGEEIPF